MGQVDRPDDVVEGIRDIKHIARGVESSTHRVCQACAGRLARGQPRTSRATDSGQGADVAVGAKGAHRVVEGVDDVALAGHGRHGRVQLFCRGDFREDHRRRGKLRAARLLAAAGKARGPIAGFDVNVVPGRGGDGAFQHSHEIVAGVRDHDIAVRSHRDPRRGAELCQDRRAAVAEPTGLPGAGDGTERVFGRCRQFANGIVAGVGDVEIRLLVEAKPRRLPEKR